MLLSPSAYLLLSASAAVALLVYLIARLRMSAFLALLLCALLFGFAAGMDLPLIARHFEKGMGDILGSVAVVIGLGAVLGKLLAISGGAEVLARRWTQSASRSQVPWTLLLLGFVVGLSVFFTVGLVILFPLLLAIARRAGVPILLAGLPMLAGLSVTHGLVPPHPGPTTALALLQADVGQTVWFSLLIGVPVAILSGPLLAPLLARGLVVAEGSMAAALPPGSAEGKPPGFWATLMTLLLPVLLMLGSTLASLLLPAGHSLRGPALFLGTPLVALLAGTLAALMVFGRGCGWKSGRLLQVTEGAVAPAALILLVVGAGGGFSRMLTSAGVGDALAGLIQGASFPPLLFGWSLAAVIRVATGSATVAITTSAGILAPMLPSLGPVNPALLAVTLGAGSLVFSHVNDGGFWFVKEYFNLTLGQTLRTWSVLETVISVSALLLALALDAFLRILP